MFNLKRRPSRPRGLKGWRGYAIGDIHGRLDLLNIVLRKIEADLERRPAHKVMLIALGDLIDRGPQSAQVVERVRTYERRGLRKVFILGNHEEILLRVLAGDASVMRSWLKFGGTECLKSYGVDPANLTRRRDQELITIVRRSIPEAHVTFLESFVDSCRFGEYLFVHAGIRPGTELSDQSQSDLRWIRDPFLFDETNHGFLVVHGHTITPAVEERPNRIGIDTGAYRTGILTALAVEGTERWYIDTRHSMGSEEG